MSADLLIKGGTVVLPYSGDVRADLYVRDGRVAALLAPDSGQTAERVIDATGRHVLPGVIDPHVHFGLGNGMEDWATESRSAAAGGVTTVFSFLMSGQSYLPEIEATRRVADATSHVDYGLHVVPCAPVHLDEMDRYVAAGITSFKYFTSFRGSEGAYLGVEGTDDGFLHAYLEQVAGYPGALACVHPENIEVVWRLRARLQAEGRDGLEAWDASRPAAVEAECVYRAMFYAEQAGCPLYLVHLSGALPLRELRAWRARFPTAPVYAETCPHFLTHHKEMPIGSLGKINPPLRSPADVDALWTAIADGVIDTIGSDHVPRRRDKKAGSIWTASAGFPGTGAILPVMLSEGVHRRGLPLRRVAELCAANPARIMGCYPRKGSLQVGSDADITIVDLDLQRTVTPELFQSYADYSLYDGWTLTGWPVATIVRGQVVMDGGTVVGDSGWGRYLARSGAAAAPSGATAPATH
ncbi:MAG: amidohydrolase family protein [Dehalococcoidia bacterium]